MVASKSKGDSSMAAASAHKYSETAESDERHLEEELSFDFGELGKDKSMSMSMEAADSFISAGEPDKTFFGKSGKSKKSGKSGKACIAGQTGFKKVKPDTKQPTITRLDNLQVGDTIHGMDNNKAKNEECKVLSLTSSGNRTVYGNYTSDHYNLPQDGLNSVVAHGETGETGEPVTVYQVLSTCPVVTDETGKATTFSLCVKNLSKDGALPWSSYIRIHATVLKLVTTTGVHDLSAFFDVDRAAGYLDDLCASALACSESADCDEFESKMNVFISQEIVPEKRGKVMAAFPQMGEASSKGSISALISSGKSVSAE